MGIKKFGSELSKLFCSEKHVWQRRNEGLSEKIIRETVVGYEKDVHAIHVHGGCETFVVILQVVRGFLNFLCA